MANFFMFDELESNVGDNMLTFILGSRNYRLVDNIFPNLDPGILEIINDKLREADKRINRLNAEEADFLEELRGLR
jgi:hypothetical protein